MHFNHQALRGLPVGPQPPAKRADGGFTLTELLVVLLVMVLLAGLLGPAFQSIKGGQDLTSMAVDIKGVLDQARSQAMAQNTYVYVGFQEVDALTPTSSDGIGRVAAATLFSSVGTRPTNLSANVSAVGKVRTFDNLHFSDSASLTTGALANRPGGSASGIPSSSVINLMGVSSALSFAWPLGTGGRYSFTKVIEFDPRGVARLQTNTSTPAEIQPYIEIALVPSRGNQVTSLAKNQAAIQIDGVTGRTTLYRP